MARRAKAKAQPRSRKAPKVGAGELLTLLDFARYAVSRFAQEKLVFAHGTTDPVAEAASLIGDPAEVESVLDLCGGSGCLAILAARHFANAAIDAVDISKDALAVASRNVADYGLEDRIALHRGDLFAPLSGRRYDLIISNP